MIGAKPPAPVMVKPTCPVRTNFRKTTGLVSGLRKPQVCEHHVGGELVRLIVCADHPPLHQQVGIEAALLLGVTMTRKVDQIAILGLAARNLVTSPDFGHDRCERAVEQALQHRSFAGGTGKLVPPIGIVGKMTW